MAVKLRTSALSPAIGAEVRGIDLRRPMDADHQAEIRHLLDGYQLLVFREQKLTAEDQVRVLNTFGPVADENANGSYHSLVSNVRDDGLFSTWPLLFHSVWAWRDYQPPVLSLYGMEVDETTIPTQFASGTAAARRLTPDLRSRLVGLNVVNSDDFTKAAENAYGARVRLLDLPEMPPESTHPRAMHPVVRRHPRTAEPFLFTTELHTSHIDGLSREESETLIQELFGKLYAPDNVYSHHWVKGDLLVWDNLAIQHGRKSLAGGKAAKARVLRRVVVSEKSAGEQLAGTIAQQAGSGPPAARAEAAR